MNDDMTTSPRPGSGADLSRRVERLEDVTTRLSEAVATVNHRLDLVTLNQHHNTELMSTKFGSLEAQTSALNTKVDQIITTIQQAMTDPASNPQSKRMLDEYAAFQNETRDGLKRADEMRDALDDYILVQKTKAETASNLAQRAFGSSLLGAMAAIVAIVIGVLALLGQH